MMKKRGVPTGVALLPWPYEKRLEALQRVEAGETVRAVCEDMGMCRETLYSWQRTAASDPEWYLHPPRRNPRRRPRRVPRRNNLHGIYFRARDVLRVLRDEGRGLAGLYGTAPGELVRRRLNAMYLGDQQYVSERVTDQILIILNLHLSFVDLHPVWLESDGDAQLVEREMPEDWMDRSWSLGYDKAMAA